MSDTVYIVVSIATGAPLSVYTTLEAANADVAEVSDGRTVEPWVVKDGYTIGRRRPLTWGWFGVAASLALMAASAVWAWKLR